MIQALTLTDQEPNVALRLVDLYFESKRSGFEDLRALLARARAHESLGSLGLAIEALKQVLELERLKPNQRSTAYVDYPYLVATSGLTDEYDNAIAVLLNRKGDLTFPVDSFKWHASLAIIEDERHNEARAREHAKAALQAAGAKVSVFQFHKGVGLVGSEHASTIEVLRRIDA